MTPPQTPHSRFSWRATSRHSTRTTQPAQICWAWASSAGFSEKKSSWLPSSVHRPSCCNCFSVEFMSTLLLAAIKKPPGVPAASQQTSVVTSCDQGPPLGEVRHCADRSQGARAEFSCCGNWDLNAHLHQRNLLSMEQASLMTERPSRELAAPPCRLPTW